MLLKQHKMGEIIECYTFPLDGVNIKRLNLIPLICEIERNHSLCYSLHLPTENELIEFVHAHGIIGEF